ncbi:MAG: GDSL-type esterase/lipase family protein, partial [Opitutales bacterium]
ALDGPGRLAEFTSAYHRLIDQFSQVTPRLVLVSPIPFETGAQSHAPNLSTHNEVVALYVDAIREIARQRDLRFIDLYLPFVDRSADSPRLTENGIHLNAFGLERTAAEFGRQLGLTETSSPERRLLDLIAEKNRLWFDSWRPANWSFVYGDRMTQLFATGTDDQPSLREQLEKHKPLIAEFDTRIEIVAAGQPDPGPAVAAIEAAPLNPDLVPTVEEQLAGFSVADGFEIELFADESMGVVKPTHMAWDELGRLYVACSPTYPHTLPGEAPSDYIWVGEDRSGDGRIDHSWRLIEGLTMVQGIVPGDGGLYICDFDRLLHVRDTTGDGTADDVRVILQGFGIGDTHQLINSIAWDQGGRLWFTQGLHAFSRVETPHGISRLHQSGLWRFNPRTLKLDGFFNGAKAGHNGWGVVFD